MDQELINRIETKMEPIPSVNLRGKPANDLQIREAEKALSLKFHDDYITFIKHWGGAFIGIPVHAFGNNEMMSNKTVVDLTKSFREDYIGDQRSEILHNSYVISFDGSGNPILIDKDGKVLIIYHDTDDYKIFAVSFSEFIQKIIDDEFENEW